LVTENRRSRGHKRRHLFTSSGAVSFAPNRSLASYLRRFILAALALIFFLPVALTKAVTEGSLTDANQAVAAEISAKPMTPVDMQQVSKGFRSGVREPQQSVIRTESEWLELWRKHSNEFHTTPPTVLFDQEVAVAVFLGEKNTGGYDLTIVRAERNDDELVIYYQETSPAPGAMLIQAFMQPFHIVRINRQDLSAKVIFRRES
jgi:hypothetical protein